MFSLLRVQLVLSQNESTPEAENCILSSKSLLDIRPIRVPAYTKDCWRQNKIETRYDINIVHHVPQVDMFVQRRTRARLRAGTRACLRAVEYSTCETSCRATRGLM